MRRALFIACVSLLPACNPEVEFDVKIEGDSVVEKATLVETLLAGFGFESLVTFDLSDTQEFKNQDVRKDQVTSTRLTRLNLAATEPGGATIDFLDFISFHAEAPDVASAIVASKEVEDGATGFDCNLEDVELSPYVKAASMSITTDVTGRRPDVDTTVHALAIFHVKAHVLAR